MQREGAGGTEKRRTTKKQTQSSSSLSSDSVSVSRRMSIVDSLPASTGSAARVVLLLLLLLLLTVLLITAGSAALIAVVSSVHPATLSWKVTSRDTFAFLLLLTGSYTSHPLASAAYPTKITGIDRGCSLLRLVLSKGMYARQPNTRR